MIDFLNIDVEGLDDVVLRSNNWEKYRPLMILTETIHTSPTSSYLILEKPWIQRTLLNPRTQFFRQDDFISDFIGSVHGQKYLASVPNHSNPGFLRYCAADFDHHPDEESLRTAPADSAVSTLANVFALGGHCCGRSFDR